MTFADWLDSEYPDGIGNGTGGTYSQDDMEAAFQAGRDDAADYFARGGSFK